MACFLLFVLLSLFEVALGAGFHHLIPDNIVTSFPFNTDILKDVTVANVLKNHRLFYSEECRSVSEGMRVHSISDFQDNSTLNEPVVSVVRTILSHHRIPSDIFVLRVLVYRNSMVSLLVEIPQSVDDPEFEEYFTHKGLKPP